MLRVSNLVGFGSQSVGVAFSWETAFPTLTDPSKAFSSSAQDSSAEDILISDDGVNLYVIGGNTTKKIHQYTLSTPWDISTASYASKLLDFSAHHSGANGGVFADSGRKLYLSSGSIVYQYTLSTAWDISTASYDSKSYDVSTQVAINRTPWVSPDGGTLIIGGSDDMFQYTLSTAFDVSTASYASKTYDGSSDSISGSSQCWHINYDGSFVYVLNPTSPIIVEVEMTTPGDVSTASATGNTANVSISGNERGLSTSLNGDKFYVLSTNEITKQFDA